MSEISMIPILIVDDHSLVLEGYTRLINSDQRFQVIALANTGEEAYRLLKKVKPDVIITDLSLPGISGLKFTEKALSQHHDLKIIICSMHDTLNVVNASFAAGARGFVSKSSDPKCILDAIVAVQKNKIYLSEDMRNMQNKGHTELESMRLETLSSSEFDTFRLLAKGHSITQIAKVLSLSEKTINNYQTQIRIKLDLQTAAELVHFAIRNQIIYIPT
jgi:DNA-binding NarL/FixJ family response regulator